MNQFRRMLFNSAIVSNDAADWVPIESLNVGDVVYGFCVDDSKMYELGRYSAWQYKGAFSYYSKGLHLKHTGVTGASIGTKEVWLEFNDDGVLLFRNIAASSKYIHSGNFTFEGSGSDRVSVWHMYGMYSRCIHGNFRSMPSSVYPQNIMWIIYGMPAYYYNGSSNVAVTLGGVEVTQKLTSTPPVTGAVLCLIKKPNLT